VAQHRGLPGSNQSGSVGVVSVKSVGRPRSPPARGDHTQRSPVTTDSGRCRAGAGAVAVLIDQAFTHALNDAAFDRAIAEFAESYAEINEEDHRSLGEAVRSGRVLDQADL